MAKVITNAALVVLSHKVSRPGVHSKKRTSRLKTSKHYKKTYRGQGR